jgi:hypothetical protein
MQRIIRFSRTESVLARAAIPHLACGLNGFFSALLHLAEDGKDWTLERAL